VSPLWMAIAWSVASILAATFLVLGVRRLKSRNPRQRRSQGRSRAAAAVIIVASMAAVPISLAIDKQAFVAVTIVAVIATMGGGFLWWAGS
jgi:hypothetical protein